MRASSTSTYSYTIMAGREYLPMARAGMAPYTKASESHLNVSHPLPSYQQASYLEASTLEEKVL